MMLDTFQKLVILHFSMELINWPISWILITLLTLKIQLLPVKATFVKLI